MPEYILARLHTIPLTGARRNGSVTATTSLDLNLTKVELPIGPDGATLPNGALLTWDAIEAIAKKDDNCFVIGNGDPRPVLRFSTRFNRSYTLRATTAAPTLLISGWPMHRIKGITPDIDTDRKIAAAGRLSGRVLDTATGLGYTAIRAAQAGASVISVELDPAVLEVASFNPWSQTLFNNPLIEQRIGSSFDVIRDFAAAQFDTVLHDPPTFSLGGELYSLEFYIQVHRVLRRGGTFFHYIGDLESRTGQSVAKGAARRMQEAGFEKITKRPDAFALVANK
jgi:uncharacterized protein